MWMSNGPSSTPLLAGLGIEAITGGESTSVENETCSHLV
jgi:hypothetical protein